MGYSTWILLFAGFSLFCWWVLCWGGAQALEGWWDWIYVSRNGSWTAEQIRFFILLCWVGHSIWFVVGLFVPMARVYW